MSRPIGWPILRVRVRVKVVISVKQYLITVNESHFISKEKVNNKI
jgi:hypothetical protein